MIRHRGRHIQNLQKALPDKDLSVAGIGTFALSKASKKIHPLHIIRNDKPTFAASRKPVSF
jgi:hypothetical protein